MQQNPVDRCYRCKKLLFTKLIEKAAEYGISMILEGTNAEDLNGYRPGFWRYGNWGSTVLWCSLDLQKKRYAHGRKNWDCRFPTVRRCPVLRHVFPYGTTLSYGEMRKAEQGEEYLRGLGLYNVRLRIYGDLVRIEADPEAFPILEARRLEIVQTLKNVGYRYITLDLEGFRSGSMDIGITNAYNERAVQKEER